MFSASVLRILVASPSDTVAERSAVPASIGEWNALNAEALRVLLPVLWETHASPEIGGPPQSLLNRQVVDTCHMLIGTFWTRLGTPTQQYPSGTAEEIERFIEAGKPTMLYFSSQLVAPVNLDPDQLAALKTFRDGMKTRGLLGEYETLDELRRTVVADLTRHVRPIAEELTKHAATKKRPQIVDDTETAEAHSDATTEDLSHSMVRQVVSRLGDNVALLRNRWNVFNMASRHEESRALLLELQATADQERQQLRALDPQDANMAFRESIRILGQVIAAADSLRLQRMYLDGGESWRRFVDGFETLFADLDRAIALLLSWVEGSPSGYEIPKDPSS